MVHFPGLSSPTYGFSWRYSGMSLEGLPHSGIFGSKPVCGSPKLFAAYHALHRLLAPRHSPYALSSLTIRTQKLIPTCSYSSSYSDEPNTNNEPEYDSVSSGMHTACVWSEKTTVATYSLVKELIRLRAPGFRLRASHTDDITCGIASSIVCSMPRSAEALS